MKLIHTLLSIILIALSSIKASAESSSALESLTPLDTIAFDLSQSVYTTIDGISFIEFPVILRTDDLIINAVDYWFQFDLNKLTYVSTTSTIDVLDVYTNYNSNNQYLSNTSSTTSINVYLPLYVTIMKLKFSLSAPCVEILDTDFYSITTLLNGVVSSSLFIPMAPSPGPPPIEVLSEEPFCPNTDISFSYASEVNGQSITSYAWDFGNGQTGSDQTANTTYSSDGTYTVVMESTTENGCVYSSSTDVEVAPAPFVDFSSSYDGSQNLFSFTNLSTISSGSNTNFLWDFGDNETSDLFEPTHVYASEGLYDVVLTVTSDLGCVSSTTIVIDAPVSLNELTNLNGALSIFPNPVNHALNINTTQTIRFFIVDEIGRRVSEEQLLGANQSTLISVDHLSNGIYAVVGYEKDQTMYSRFLVQH